MDQGVGRGNKSCLPRHIRQGCDHGRDEPILVSGHPSRHVRWTRFPGLHHRGGDCLVLRPVESLQDDFCRPARLHTPRRGILARRRGPNWHKLALAARDCLAVDRQPGAWWSCKSLRGYRSPTAKVGPSNLPGRRSAGEVICDSPNTAPMSSGTGWASSQGSRSAGAPHSGQYGVASSIGAKQFRHSMVRSGVEARVMKA
jgi:hypothetical protein